jgi:hypothetical protein
MTALSRRAFFAAAAACVAAPAAGAEQKVSQREAKYQDHPKGQQRCEICINFQPPNQCRFVVGPIGKQGWCQFFAAKENAH